ncbi:MAG: hypothetical protein QGF46_05810, partial [Planctomycetota bacterium]|nr:hypothetical protein [Planctomycetota bacterium]
FIKKERLTTEEREKGRLEGQDLRDRGIRSKPKDKYKILEGGIVEQDLSKDIMQKSGIFWD